MVVPHARTRRLHADNALGIDHRDGADAMLSHQQFELLECCLSSRFAGEMPHGVVD
jgi:hypothetical protein